MVAEKEKKEFFGKKIEQNEIEGELAVDVYQNENEFVIQSLIAGVRQEDLEINITDESVSIKGKRERPAQIPKENYLYQECFWGPFSRSIILPQKIDSTKASANLSKTGILTIRLPKLAKGQPRKLEITIES